MVITIRRQLGFWLLAFLGAGAVIMGMLYPPGRDPFVPRSVDLSVKGRDLYRLIIENDQRCKRGDSFVDPNSSSNSLQFIVDLLRLARPGQSNLAEKFGSWNIALDIINGLDTSFPLLISGNFDPRCLEGDINSDKILPIGNQACVDGLQLGRKGIVVISSDGRSQVLKAKHCTKTRIIGGGNGYRKRITFLTPVGKMTIQLQ